MTTTVDAIRNIKRALKAGHILHAKDTDDCAITAGLVAVPGSDVRWMIMRWVPLARDVQEDDCGSLEGVARVLCRTYLGAYVANRAALRALGEDVVE